MEKIPHKLLMWDDNILATYSVHKALLLKIITILFGTKTRIV